MFPNVLTLIFMPKLVIWPKKELLLYLLLKLLLLFGNCQRQSLWNFRSVKAKERKVKLKKNLFLMFNWRQSQPRRLLTWSKVWECLLRKLLVGYLNLKRCEENHQNHYISQCPGISHIGLIWMSNSTAWSMSGTFWGNNSLVHCINLSEGCISMRMKEELWSIFLRSWDMWERLLLRSWRGIEQNSKEFILKNAHLFPNLRIQKVRSTKC